MRIFYESEKNINSEKCVAHSNTRMREIKFQFVGLVLRSEFTATTFFEMIKQNHEIAGNMICVDYLWRAWNFYLLLYLYMRL